MHIEPFKSGPFHSEPTHSGPFHSAGGIAIYRLSPTDAQFDEAFGYALTGRHITRSDIETQRRNVDAMSESNAVSASVFVVSTAHNAIQTAALLFESPGRSALVYLSPNTATGPGPTLLLEAIIRYSESRKLNLLQTLLQTGDTRQARLIADVAFQYLAELIYMDCSVGNSGIDQPRLPSQFRLVTFSEETESIFLRALECTYEDSLDCPALTPLRTAADALAGHKSTGIFDPSGFYVILAEDEPVAILLTSRVIDRLALEVVYMGVNASGRKRGLGTLLLSLAKHRARALGLSCVTLAVDAINTPARRLYEKAGFVERARRRAWIRCI
jgi:ribosomal protein S18 acetylase RimI-like enzyme